MKKKDKSLEDSFAEIFDEIRKIGRETAKELDEYKELPFVIGDKVCAQIGFGKDRRSVEAEISDITSIFDSFMQEPIIMVFVNCIEDGKEYAVGDWRVDIITK